MALEHEAVGGVDLANGGDAEEGLPIPVQQKVRSRVGDRDLLPHVARTISGGQ